MLRIIIFCTLAACLFHTPVCSATTRSPKDSTKWLKENQLELTAREEPLVTRAHRVFTRVRAAADKTAGRPPKLLILKKSTDLYAAALPDGGIILSKNSLKACYASVSPDKGDSRLAFILGHELAHLANNDFKHLDTLSEIKAFQGDPASRSLLALFPIETKQVQATRRMQELDADGFGIVYMAMAGYDPQAIVGKDGTNFIREYLKHETSAQTYDDPTHPDPENRAARVRSKLAAVAEEVVMFKLGVHYLVHGDLRKADSLFNNFLGKFPSREVFNNIGLVHYQDAITRLSSCDRFLPSRFALPVLLDGNTIAEPLPGDTPRGVKACLASESFKEAIDEAIINFEKAKERDPWYLPAHVNLTAGYIMAGNGIKAKNAARDLLQVFPESDKAKMLEAIASYLDGIADGVDTAAPQALKKLEPLLQTSKELKPALLYNIGMIQLENREEERSKAIFRTYLESRQLGIHTNRARYILNVKALDTEQGKKLPAPTSQLKTGPVSPGIQQQLNKMTKRTDAGLKLDIYESANMTAVAARELGKDDRIELVIVRQDGRQSAGSFKKIYGTPERELLTPPGVIMVYDGFAAEVQDGVVKVVSFYGVGEQFISKMRFLNHN
ncbi:MAG: M48 family metalloprotease [Desulfuromonadales bacterium]